MAAIETAPTTSSTRLAGLLADDANLRVLSAIVLGARDRDAVAESTGLESASVEHALSHLVAAGLVTAGEELAVDLAAFREAARKHRPHVPDATAEQEAVLRNFVDAEGRLPALPARAARRRQVLEYVAERVEPGVAYTEPEINVLLGAFHDDYASLRRHLVDGGLLVRHAGIYRRT
jgi:hypothetical protein